MRPDRLKGPDANSPDQGCKILPFRLRDHIDGLRRHTAANAERDIDQLLDLSRYENAKGDIEDYRARMVENLAAILLLSALVAIAGFDLLDLEQIEHFASLNGY